MRKVLSFFVSKGSLSGFYNMQMHHSEMLFCQGHRENSVMMKSASSKSTSLTNAESDT